MSWITSCAGEGGKEGVVQPPGSLCGSPEAQRPSESSLVQARGSLCNPPPWSFTGCVLQAGVCVWGSLGLGTVFN
jgi:hypothetical protein